MSTNPARPENGWEGKADPGICGRGKGRSGLLVIALFCSAAVWCAPAQASRVKDISKLTGVRSNQLFGYGLVMGLNGSGDKQGTEFTIQSLTNMLTKMGINVDPNQVKVKNVAAVMVTAELPAFARPGMRLDALVSSIGDAKSLQGGTLLLTQLQGVDGEVYALAQGPVSIGGFSAGAGGAQAQMNHPTVGTIPGGALVEKEPPPSLGLQDRLEFVLQEPDFTTAENLARAINREMGFAAALAADSRTVRVEIPDEYRDRTVEYVARIEAVEVPVDGVARVVINERTGTVVMGENVRISTVAVSHGGLSVIIQEQTQVSQPAPFGSGQTAIVKDKSVTVEDKEARLMMLPAGVTLGEVVRALNAVGVTPRDLIVILQAMKNAGALKADLVIM